MTRRLLITAGGTREPIDPVRYVGNRSSGKTGLQIAAAGVRAGFDVTLIAAPGVGMVRHVRRIDVETAADMLGAVLREFAGADALLMVAAVADYRPVTRSEVKITSGRSSLVLELEPTPDILSHVAGLKRSDQRTVGFSLQTDPDPARPDLAKAFDKLRRKHLDLLVYNAPATLESDTITPILLHTDGRSEPLGYRTKAEFADLLIGRTHALFT